MQTEIGQWGNSIALRIPAALARQMGFEKGSKASIEVKDGCMLITTVSKISRKERYARILASAKAIGPDTEVDWGADAGRENVEW